MKIETKLATGRKLAHYLTMQLGYQIIKDHSKRKTITQTEVGQAKVAVFDRLVECLPVSDGGSET